MNDPLAYKSYKFSSKMQIKYDINAQNFMIREHALCALSNMIFGLKVIKT